jgi:hypothetical protein
MVCTREELDLPNFFGISDSDFRIRRIWSPNGRNLVARRPALRSKPNGHALSSRDTRFSLWNATGSSRTATRFVAQQSSYQAVRHFQITRHGEMEPEHHPPLLVDKEVRTLSHRMLPALRGVDQLEAVAEIAY